MPGEIALREHTPKVSDDPIVESARDLWTDLKVSVTRVPGQTDWTLTPGSRIGFASVVEAGTRTSVRVLPKIDNLDLFFLADYAFGKRGPVRAPALGPALLDALQQDPTAMMLLWFVRDVDAFATRWLRRNYRSQDLVLDGEIRGEILFDRYIEDHLAVSDAATVPVRVNERSLDTPNNRLLKAGLRHAALLSHLLPVPLARTAVRRAVKAALPRVAQVADVPPTRGNVRDVSARGPQRHYASVIELTKDLLRGSLLGDSAGARNATAFTVDLPLLFQEALRGVLADTGAIEMEAGRPSATILNPTDDVITSSRVDPDYVLRRSDDPTAPALLLDAKYKRVVERGKKTDDDDLLLTAANTRLRIKRADVYQATAYRHHTAWPGATAALVYPVSVPERGLLPAPYTVRGFDAPVHVLFLDVGPRARANLPHFRDRVLALMPKALAAGKAA